MKKNIIIVIAGILLLIMFSLFYTYATNVTMEPIVGDVELSYRINISDPKITTITVEAGKIKVFDIILSHNNSETINYGLAYNQVETDSVIVAQTDLSMYRAIDNLENTETRQISLVVKNNSSSSITYDIIPISGYKNGGDLVIPANHTLIDDVYSISIGEITGSVYDYIPSVETGEVPDIEDDDTGVNLDESGANSPDLVEGLIPVMYNSGRWLKASSTNSSPTYQWYDYNEKKWANAVLVSSENRDTYINASLGTRIDDSDILAHYVWIPRYKYRVWNINKVIGTDSYNAKTTGIDITFEREKATTGTIKCTNYSYADASTAANSPNETCSASNGNYYTHPAFTFGSDELRGIWVGKFEISSSDPTVKNGGGNSTTLSVRIKPTVTSWRSNKLSNYSYVIQNMQKSNNEYGLSTDKTVADSHMIKNMEWGAVAYLTHSEYGRCNGDTCEEVTINNSGNYITGNAADSVTGAKVDGIANIYNTAKGKFASTTANVYGIYDLSGGAYEYTMGNMSTQFNSYSYNSFSAGSAYTYSTETAKYLDTYAAGIETKIQAAYNRAKLGDATGEVITSSGGYGAWYSDNAFVPPDVLPWFTRGGDNSIQSVSGIFYFNGAAGDAFTYVTTRAVLVGLN